MLRHCVRMSNQIELDIQQTSSLAGTMPLISKDFLAKGIFFILLEFNSSTTSRISLRKKYILGLQIRPVKVSSLA